MPGFAAFAAGLRAELGALAYLLAGHGPTADAAVDGALEEVGAAWAGSADDAAPDRCRLAVVRHALVLAEHLDRSQDDVFWRGGAWALQRLPVDQRVIVALWVTTGLGDDALAALLGTPVRLVRRRLEAGRAGLRRHLQLTVDEGDDALAAALRLVADRHAGAAAPVVATAVRSAAAPGATAAAAAAPVDDDPPADDATHLTGPLPLVPAQRRWAAAATTGVRLLALVAVGALVWGMLRGGSGDVVVSSSPAPSRSAPAAPTSAPAAVTTSSPAVSATVPTGPAGTAARATKVRTTTRTTTKATTRTTARTTARTTRPAVTRTSPRATTRTTTRTTTSTRPAVSRPPAVPPGLLRNAASGRCVSVPANPPWGAQLRLADCTGGPTQQVGDGAAGTLLLSGLCLDDYGWGTAPGTAAVVWTCYPAHPANQQWVVGGDGSIRSVHANLCLDAAGNGRAAGTPLVLNPCDGTGSQSWRRT